MLLLKNLQMRRLSQYIEKYLKIFFDTSVVNPFYIQIIEKNMTKDGSLFFFH